MSGIQDINELFTRWTDDGDTDAGARILRYLAEDVIIWKVTPRGVLLSTGPRWESRR